MRPPLCTCCRLWKMRPMQGVWLWGRSVGAKTGRPGGGSGQSTPDAVRSPRKLCRLGHDQRACRTVPDGGHDGGPGGANILIAGVQPNPAKSLIRTQLCHQTDSLPCHPAGRASPSLTRVWMSLLNAGLCSLCPRAPDCPRIAPPIRGSFPARNAQLMCDDRRIGARLQTLYRRHHLHSTGKRAMSVLPKETRIGHVHLKVADLERAIGFYQGVLGFDLVTRYGAQAAFLSAGGYHHHIGLNTWESQGGTPAPAGHTRPCLARGGIAAGDRRQHRN